MSAPGGGDDDTGTDSTGEQIPVETRTDRVNTVGESRRELDPSDGGGKTVREHDGPL